MSAMKLTCVGMNDSYATLPLQMPRSGGDGKWTSGGQWYVNAEAGVAVADTGGYSVIWHASAGIVHIIRFDESHFVYVMNAPKNTLRGTLDTINKVLTMEYSGRLTVESMSDGFGSLFGHVDFTPMGSAIVGRCTVAMTPLLPMPVVQFEFVGDGDFPPYCAKAPAHIRSADAWEQHGATGWGIAVKRLCIQFLIDNPEFMDSDWYTSKHDER